MKIYTKTGDLGETGLFGGSRVSKDHLRIAAYGDVDELNSVLGFMRSLINDSDDNVEGDFNIDELLEKIQNDLFNIGAILATPDKQKLEGRASAFVQLEDITALEKAIDRMEVDLSPLQTFILPGGGELASRVHIARTVCRRAERSVVTLASQEKVEEEILMYINRLSDFLFVLARWANWQEGISDIAWKKK